MILIAQVLSISKVSVNLTKSIYSGFELRILGCDVVQRRLLTSETSMFVRYPHCPNIVESHLQSQVMSSAQSRMNFGD